MQAIEKVATSIEKSKEKDGYTLMDHLAEIIERIMLNPKEYPLDKFEELSYIIKLTRMKPPHRLPDTEIAKKTHIITPNQEWLNKYLSRIADVIFSILYNLT